MAEIKNIVDAFGNSIEEQLHCTVDSHGLMCPEDKVKLANIEEGANNYTHPATHDASIITEDENHRFVTDNEKISWNSKASGDLATETINGLMSSEDKVKLNSLENYTHPESHDASIITQDATHRFVTDAEKASWNNMSSTGNATVDTDGLMSFTDKSKLDGIEAGANNYTHPSTHPATMITEDETHRFVTDEQITNWSDKASTDLATATTNGLMSSDDKVKLDSLQTGANGTEYVHPATHPATMITEDDEHQFVTSTEKNSWNNKVELSKINAYLGLNEDDIIKVHFPHRIFDGGDCSIIETKDKNIMIDFGVDGSQAELLQYLLLNNITKIDYFIISHYHADHVGKVTVIQDLLNNDNIDTSSAIFYLPHGSMDWTLCTESDGYYEEIKGYETQLLSLLSTTGNTYIRPTEGETLEIGECVLKFLNLKSEDFTEYYSCLTKWNYDEGTTTNYNNFSMVVELTYRKHNFLFTGDIEELAQSKIYNRINKPDVLKIEHHCCNYGTYEGYGRLLEPEVAIIGEFESGAGDTMKRSTYAIVQNCADVYSTNVSGNIVVSSTGFDIFTESENGKINYKDSVTLTSGQGIRPGTDLDEMFTPGEYFSQSEARTKTLKNTPENSSGFKLIIDHLSIGTTSTRQTYITANMRNCNIYTRTSYKGKYYDWVCMTPNSEGITLKDGDNLNNCLLLSDYVYSNSTGNIDSILNKPDDLDSGFKLINHQISENAFKQIIIPNNMNNGNLYTRSIIDNKFSDWFTINADNRKSLGDSTLWGGSWGSGDLTVNDAHRYRMVLIILYDKDTVIPAVQYNGILRGVGGYAYTNGLTTYQINASYVEEKDVDDNVTGYKYTMKNCHCMEHINNDNMFKTTACSVSKIIGLLEYE